LIIALSTSDIISFLLIHEPGEREKRGDLITRPHKDKKCLISSLGEVLWSSKPDREYLVSGGIDKPLGLLSSPELLILYSNRFHKTYAVAYPVFVASGLIHDM
jgi:hypothetical protein